MPHILCDSPNKWLQVSWSRRLVLYASCSRRNRSILITEQICFIPRIGTDIFPAFAVWGLRCLLTPGWSRLLHLNQMSVWEAHKSQQSTCLMGTDISYLEQNVFNWEADQLRTKNVYI